MKMNGFLCFMYSVWLLEFVAQSSRCIEYKDQRVKVSHSLVGVTGPLYLGHSIYEAEPFAALSFPDSTEAHIYYRVDRVSQSPDSEERARTRDLPATFCTITKSL